MSSLADLPHDVLMDIVTEYLTTAEAFRSLACVSKRLHDELFGVPRVSVDAPATRRELLEPLVAVGLRQFAALQEVHLFDFRQALTDSQWALIAVAHEESLRELTLRDAAVASPRLPPALVALSLENCRQLAITERMFAECRALVELNLSRTFVSDMELKRHVLPHVPALRALRLRSCKNIVAPDLADLADLRVLDLSRTRITDSTLAATLSASPAELQVLFLNGCAKLRRPRLDGCERLRTVSLRGSIDVIRPSFVGCAALSELDLSETAVDDVALVAVLDALAASLSFLSVRSCWELTADPWGSGDGDVTAPPVLELPFLESVNCSFTRLEGRFVSRLVRAAPSLAAFTAFQTCALHANGGLTSAGWGAFELTEANLGGTLVQDADIVAVLSGSPWLRSLDLTACSALCELAPTDLVHGRLERLVLDKCQRLSEHAVAAVCGGSNFPALRSLSLNANPQLGRIVVGAAPQLTSLSCRMCLHLESISIDHGAGVARVDASGAVSLKEVVVDANGRLRRLILRRVPAAHLQQVCASLPARVVVDDGRAELFDEKSDPLPFEIRPVTPPPPRREEKSVQGRRIPTRLAIPYPVEVWTDELKEEARFFARARKPPRPAQRQQEPEEGRGRGEEEQQRRRQRRGRGRSSVAHFILEERIQALRERISVLDESERRQLQRLERRRDAQLRQDRAQEAIDNNKE